MATTFRTPGVYIQEIPVFPPSVAEVETAVPAFIGYTQTATKHVQNDLILRPTKIYSLKEYEQYFGFPEADDIALTVTEDTAAGTFTATDFTPPTVSYFLYYSVKMYFENGGGKCFIVSVGTYQDPASITLNGDGGTDPTTNSGLQDGLDVVALEDEPTLIVIPDAATLDNATYQTLVRAVLLQCDTLQDRFGIFDVPNADVDLDDAAITAVRGAFGTANLKYGAAYYPFLRTTMTHFVPEDELNVMVTINGTAAALATYETTQTGVYNAAKKALQPGEQLENFVVMPPSGAVTGAYAATDTKRGVWKAPANVALNGVVEPMVKINAARQGPLNVDSDGGKSINVLRAFSSRGTVIWGARTLAGNDNEWRYVSVRRFFNMVEESVKKSTYWAVFEPNDANTWVKVRGMIENYLTQKWREGALAGATTKEAFFVRCGLGTTMSAQDILEGRMFVEIGMAVVRPAEFIILRFFHKLQTS
jgi:uncharacterized protein